MSVVTQLYFQIVEENKYKYSCVTTDIYILSLPLLNHTAGMMPPKSAFDTRSGLCRTSKHSLTRLFSLYHIPSKNRYL
jgi:hypothetical protein